MGGAFHRNGDKRMLRNRGAAVVLAGLILAGAILSYCSPQQQQNEPARWYQQTNSHVNDKTPIFLAIGTWADAHHDAIEALSAIGVFVFTIVLAVSTAFLWRSTKALWKVTDKTLRHAERTTERQLRAYIGVEPGGVIRLQGEDLLIGHYTIRNVGGIPAKDIAMFSIASYYQDGSQRDFKIGQLYQTTNAVVPRAKMTFGTASATSIDSGVNVDALTEDQETASGVTGYIFVYGRVTYTDDLGTDGWTDFCHRYPCSMLEDGVGGGIKRKYARYHELGGNNAG
jgi:hypothetical protein